MAYSLRKIQTIQKSVFKKKLLKISLPSNYQWYHLGGCLLLFSIITHTQKYVPSLMLCLGTHHGSLFATPWTVALQAPLSMGFSRQEYWSGLPCPPPGISPTQGSNPGLSHCKRIVYQQSHQGSPRILEWVLYPYSSRSSQPRNQTGVSWFAGRFFTNWAIREAWVSHEMPWEIQMEVSCRQLNLQA